MNPSPVIALNHAVAVAMRDGPEAGLARIDALDPGGALEGYHLYHAARADLLRRLERPEAAGAAYQAALERIGVLSVTRVNVDRRVLLALLAGITLFLLLWTLASMAMLVVAPHYQCVISLAGQSSLLVLAKKQMRWNRFILIVLLPVFWVWVMCCR